MSMVSVQCKGSGQPSGAGVNAKRAQCSHCGTIKDVRPDGKFRKHMKLTRTRHLK